MPPKRIPTSRMNGHHNSSAHPEAVEGSSDESDEQLISEDDEIQNGTENDRSDQALDNSYEEGSGPQISDDDEEEAINEDEDASNDQDDEEEEDDDDEDEDEEDEEEADESNPTKRANEEAHEPEAVKKAKWDNPEDEPLPGDNNEQGKNITRIKLYKDAKDRSQRLIVILEKANLEIVKIGKSSHGLLNCDEHMNLIRKYKKDPAFCRPDIVHQCLLMLFDSPLNRAGLLQVYIHTMNNVLIQINPQTRFPRTFKRFASLMVQLLTKGNIKSANGPEFLLRVIKNPVTSHLPVGCRKIGTSFKAEKLIKPSELINSNAPDEPIVVVIGAMAHGEAAVDYTEESVCISKYPLSGALACTKIVSAFEEAWGIH